jgi:hypothetical protein
LIVTARIIHCSDAEYFADSASKVPTLSQSIAHILVTQSPLHAWLRHPKLGNQPEESTKATDEGTVLHKLLLGKGTDVELIDAPDFRTKAAREARDAAIAAGKVPMITEKFAEVEVAAAVLRENCAQQGFEFRGDSEVVIEWSEGNVLCRGRLDHLILNDGVILDVKKTRNANPKYLQRQVMEYGYALQDHVYRRAVEALRPDLVGRVDLVFLFCEIEPPYSVVPARLDGAFREIGGALWKRALHTWERCLAENEWPGYCTSPVVLEAPAWVLSEHATAGFDWRV